MGGTTSMSRALAALGDLPTASTTSRSSLPGSLNAYSYAVPSAPYPSCPNSVSGIFTTTSCIVSTKMRVIASHGKKMASHHGISP